jgi:hypothetical protein
VHDRTAQPLYRHPLPERHDHQRGHDHCAAGPAHNRNQCPMRSRRSDICRDARELPMADVFGTTDFLLRVTR